MMDLQEVGAVAAWDLAFMAGVGEDLAADGWGDGGFCVFFGDVWVVDLAV